MMIAINRSVCILLATGLLCLVASCASTTDGRLQKERVREPSRALDLARQQIDAGQYQNAIDIYMTEYRSRPNDKVLVREYVKGLEDIMAVGEKASHDNDLVSSGRVYYLLHTRYPYFKGLANQLSFTRTELDKKLSQSRKSLSAQGFQEYRQGNLDEAIALWESLLSIDPDNAEIKGAVKTARLQQQTIKDRENSGR